MPKAREWSEEEKQWLKDNLRYDSETGNLFWTTTTSRREKGLAGYSNGNGYLKLRRSIKGKVFRYLNHRVVWFLNYGYVPDFLDHIDGDKLNNRVENLRPATNGLNQRNQMPRGKLKFKGVHKIKLSSSVKYRSYAWQEGKQLQLGVFKTPEEAARAYDKFVEEELSPLERQFSKTNEEMGLYDND